MALAHSHWGIQTGAIVKIEPHAKETSTRLVGIVMAFATLVATPTLAQSRFVYVNGARMTNLQIVQLEYFACTSIPNGAYWLNLVNGAWGYMGNWQVQGFFGDQCGAPGNTQALQRRKSLSERGRLYSPSEILSGKNY